jgi:SEC-C motif-containing protein
MRSRYTAFVLANEPYLLATWHPRTRPKSVPFEPDIAWQGLKVVGTRDVGPDKAEVEFIARFRVGDHPDGRIQERSRFVREDGFWLYLDGQFRPEGDRSPREGRRPPRDRGRPPRK